MELVEAVIEIFERNGFDAEAVTPAAIFPGYNTKKILDVDFARFIVANKNLVRQGNMLQKVSLPAQVAAGAPEPPKKNPLLPYLIVGFVILLAVLGLVLMMRK